MSDGRVLVAGALHLDVVVDAPRLPRPDETLMGAAVRYVCGGKGGNQAVASARHGAPTAFAGRLADDGFGQTLLANLQSAGVDTALIQQAATGASGMSVAIVDDRGDYGAVVVSGVNRDIDPAALTWPPGTGHLLLQNEVPEPVNLALARMAADQGAKTVLNAAPMRPLDPGLLALVDILIVNRIEAEALLGGPVATIDAALRAVDPWAGGPADLIVTLGADGLVHRRKGQGALHHEAPCVPVASSHGAGDMFCGALVARLAQGDAMAAALSYAMAAAALFVSTPVADRDRIGPDAVRALLDRF
ncbi:MULTISPECIES: ribokinase [unclassified Roseitalea]|uniref:ribokinase n=1 Tax=unclassified Roseitalea TaxID=2639107 RepID=UPI00273E85ED|nr:MULTISPECIES: ribokinase [unclassified Roseitalea]